MRIPVISFGNSKVILLSTSLIKKYKIKDTLELTLKNDHIILKSKSAPRKGWDKAFKKMHKNGDDNLEIIDVFAEENFYE
jgi:antitoxin MazE